MAIWRKPLQFINVMLANRSPISVTERGPGRMTYAKKKKKKPFAEHDLRVTLHCAGKKIKPFAEHDLRVTLHCAGNKSSPYTEQDFSTKHFIPFTFSVVECSSGLLLSIFNV